MKRGPTHYQVLDIREGASQELVDAAWKILMRRFHPDGAEPNAEKAVRINQAHDILSDPKKREAYDLQLHEERAARKPQPIERAYPPAYPDAYPIVNINTDRVVGAFVESFMENLGIKKALTDAGGAALEQLARDNPVIANLLRKKRQAG